nr:hypothetical protein [Tanacetum cinerariifolium]
THGVSSAHHARSNGVPVSVPSVVPQGLALLLVDGATQTDPEDSLLSNGVPVSVPSVVPQGLALLLVDGATQTDPEDSLL